jgi:hypothetical protein
MDFEGRNTEKAAVFRLSLCLENAWIGPGGSKDWERVPPDEGGTLSAHV